MPRVRIIPVLLLNNGGLYKTVKFRDARYIGDPINTVKIFNEKEADELVLLDFTASKEKRGIDFKKITEIAGEAFMPMAYGGAISSLDDAKRVFDCGYEKVALNSALFTNPGLVTQIAGIYGAQAVVAAIDVKKNILGKYKVYAYSGTVSHNYTPGDWAVKLAGLGAGEILLNAIDNDGTWEGYNYDLIKTVSRNINIPLIACGGAGNTADFEKAVKAGASAVSAASMFIYQKKGMGVLISFPASFKLTRQ